MVGERARTVVVSPSLYERAKCGYGYLHIGSNNREAAHGTMVHVILKNAQRAQNSNFDHGSGNSDVGQFCKWRCMSLGNYSIEKGICANSFVTKALVA